MLSLAAGDEAKLKAVAFEVKGRIATRALISIWLVSYSSVMEKSSSEAKQLFIGAIGPCNEVIRMLLAKPVDEAVLFTMSTHLCQQLQEATGMLQASSSELVECGGMISAEVLEVLSACYEFHQAYFLGMSIHTVESLELVAQ